LGALPNAADKIAQLGTRHRSAVFYLSWFFKLYRRSESGWEQVQTPDNGAIMCQDAFFQQCLDAIARKLNSMIAHEMWKAANRGE
jgi:hypothetical protein